MTALSCNLALYAVIDVSNTGTNAPIEILAIKPKDFKNKFDAPNTGPNPVYKAAANNNAPINPPIKYLLVTRFINWFPICLIKLIHAVIYPKEVL